MTMTGVGARTLAQEVFPMLEAAQHAMATARDVPSEVEQLIDRVADQLDGSLPRWATEGVDPYLGQALLAAALAGEKGLRADNDDDRRRRVRLALERMRQALRDLIDESVAGEDRDIKQVTRWVTGVVGLPYAELAPLLGVSPRTLQRWLAQDGSRPEGMDEARVRMVARTVAHLRHVFTGPGTAKWFLRPHPDLEGRPPLQLLDDPLNLPVLTRLASRTRSTLAT
jgi:uncharacterized protein (DUF2384 family)